MILIKDNKTKKTKPWKIKELYCLETGFLHDRVSYCLVLGDNHTSSWCHQTHEFQFLGMMEVAVRCPKVNN